MMAGVRTRLGSLLGPVGLSAAIQGMTAESVPAGEGASVVAGGTPLARTFHLKVPQGMAASAAVPQDEATAGFVASAGSATAAAVRAAVSAKLPFLDVRDFGAVGDGATNDTAAIQAALDSGAKRVILPRGEFLATSLNIPEGRSLTGGDGAVLKVAAAASTTVINMAGAGAAVVDLLIDGNSQAHSSASQVLVRVSAEGCAVDGVRVVDAYDQAFQFDPSAKHGLITGCVVSDSGTIDNCNAFEIRGSYIAISDCHVYNHGNGHAFRFGNTTAVPAEHITVTGCVVRNSLHNAYTLETGSRFIAFTGCIAKNVPQAIKGDGTASYITVNGCLFEDIELDTAFNLSAVPNVTAVGTVLRNAAGGLRVGADSVVEACTVENIIAPVGEVTSGGIFAGPGTVVSGNKLRNVKGAAIIVTGYGTVSNNRIDACGAPGIHYSVLVGNSALLPGSVIQGNVMRDPIAGHVTSTAFALWGTRATVSGNVLVGGSMVRGIRALDGSDHYIVGSNVMSAATTPVVTNNALNKLVINNI